MAIRTLELERSRQTERLPSESRPAPAASLSTTARLSAAPLSTTARLSPDTLDLGKLPFHKLAQHSLGDALTTLRGQVDKLGPEAMPHDDSVYALRKSVFRLRTRLDLFSHAFAEHPKAWQRARVMLDDGYEALGQFKDLYDSQGLASGKRDEKTGAPLDQATAHPVYRDQDIATRRARMLAWRSEFAEALPALDKLPRKAEPLDKPLDRKLQSRFFWGGDTRAPKAKMSGVENIRRLVRDLTSQAIGEFASVQDLKNLRTEARQAEFHDFRKRMRVILNVMDNFPQMARSLPEKALVTAIVDRYGTIEDRIVALKLAEDRDDKAEAHKITADVDERWHELRDWQTAADIPTMLQGLRHRLD